MINANSSIKRFRAFDTRSDSHLFGRRRHQYAGVFQSRFGGRTIAILLVPADRRSSAAGRGNAGMLVGCRFLAHRDQPIGRFAAVLVGLAMMYHFGIIDTQRLQPSAPGPIVWPIHLDWQEACLWASDDRNMPPTARFITPRMAQTFKWYAHRAEVATWKDMPQDAKELVQWRTRIQDLFHDTDGSDPRLSLARIAQRIRRRTDRTTWQKIQADFIITEAIRSSLEFKNRLSKRKLYHL